MRIDEGRECVRRQKWGTAYAHLSAAEEEGLLDAEDLERLALAAHLTGRIDESIDALSRAHQRFLADGKSEDAARCAIWLVFTLHARGDVAQAGGWLARARRLLDDGGRECVELGYMLVPKGLFALREGDMAGAYGCFTRAVELGERFGDTDLVTLARQAQGRVLIAQGELARGISLLDEAMVAVTAGEVSPVIAGNVYCSVIEACSQIFDLRRAQEWTTALERWCASQPEMIPYRGHCLLRRSEILLLHGSWQEALDEAIRASSQTGGSDAFYRIGDVHRLRGDFAAAEEAYRKSAQLGSRPRPGIALLRLAQGQVNAAAAAIRTLAVEAKDAGTRPLVLAAYAEIMLAAGDLAAARRAADGLAAIAARLNAPLLGALSCHARGAVLLAEGDAGEALACLRVALDSWRELGAPYEAARTRVLIGRACRESGDCDSAELELQAAGQAFRQLGATPDADRKCGPAKPESPLTDRELQVLRLVAAGLTNRDIATRLHISEKTVARHISNMFTKLDLTSRAAATAYAFQHGLAGAATT